MYFFTFIYIANRVVFGEIYTTGKNFTLPAALTAVTNLTSEPVQFVQKSDFLLR